MTQPAARCQRAAGFPPEAFGYLVEAEEGSFWFQARNRLIVWATKKYFPSATTFLEVGCGTGYVLKGLAESVPSLKLAGCELFEEGLLHARERLPDVPLSQADARDLPFHAEFDLAGAFDVLEHIDDDEAALASLHDALVPGGGLLLTVPQHPRLWSPADEYAEHQRRYTRTELCGKLERAGFKTLRVTSFVTLLLPLMVASRTRERHREIHYEPAAEHQEAQRLQRPLSAAMATELWLIRHGVPLPVGGSLLAVAVR